MGSTNKKGFQNSRLVDKIKKNGSASLPQPNDRNVRISKKQVIKGRPINPTLPYLLKAPRKPAGLDNLIESSLAENNINWSEVNSAEYDSLYGYISEQEIDGGIVGGKLIRPKYDNVELEKSIDTRIFELIPTPPAPEPDTVPRPIYNDVVNQVEDLTKEVERLNITGSILNSTISELQIINDSLRVEADNERLKANIANDQRDISNAQVASTTIDLQNAVQNSINEAIERVSLTARIEALQESFRVQKEVTEEREKQNAAQTALEGLNGFFQQTENSGWKISANDVKDEGRKGIYFNVENSKDFSWRNGEKGIAFFNFSTEEQTFTISESIGWIEFPKSFKVPARTEQSAGVTTVTYKVSNVGKTKPRKKVLEGTVIINTSSGDKLQLKAYYRKEVKRKDKWGSRGTAKAFVGQDKTGG